MDRRDLGDYAAARPLAERSVAIAEAALGSKHPEVARSLHTLATIFAGLGDYSEAMRLFERATRINEEVLQPADPERARTSWLISDLLPLSGTARTTWICSSGYSRLARNAAVSPIPARRKASTTWPNCCPPQTTSDERGRYLNEPSNLRRDFWARSIQRLAAAAANLANLLSRTGDTDQAGRLYERALGVWEKSLGADHPKVATALVNLARLYLEIGNYADAGPLLDRALAIQLKGLGPEHPDVAVTLMSRAELAAHTGRATEAFATAARAEALSREHLRLTVRTLPERQALAYASSLPSAPDLMLQLASSHADDSDMATGGMGRGHSRQRGGPRRGGRPPAFRGRRRRTGDIGACDSPGVGPPAPRRAGGARHTERSAGASPSPAGRGANRQGSCGAGSGRAQCEVPRRPVENPRPAS